MSTFWEAGTLLRIISRSAVGIICAPYVQILIKNRRTPMGGTGNIQLSQVKLCESDFNFLTNYSLKIHTQIKPIVAAVSRSHNVCTMQIQYKRGQNSPCTILISVTRCN